MDDIKKILEAAGVPMDAPKVKELIENDDSREELTPQDQALHEIIDGLEELMTGYSNAPLGSKMTGPLANIDPGFQHWIEKKIQKLINELADQLD